jgi:O-Antigen ligase
VLLPAALTLVLAFRAGGFFADAPAKLALLLLVVLIGRATLAERPFAGWSTGVAGAAAALALLAVWTLLSASWSHAPFRALSEFDRTLAYLLILLVTSCFGREARDPDRALRWLALVIAAIAAAALATRLFPGTFPSSLGRDPSRLAFPLTYWNSLAILCAVGITLVLHCTAAPGTRAAARIAAAGAVPVLATALYFTFSRGGAAAAAIGVVAYALIARPPRLLLSLSASFAPAAIAVYVAYRADELATDRFVQASGEARWVAVALVVCVIAAMLLRAAALRVETRLDRQRLSPAGRRIAWLAAAAAIAAALIVTNPVAGVSDHLEEQWRAFLKAGPLREPGDTRHRFGRVEANGRIEQWRVSRSALARDPLTGSGAGTFRLEWQRARDTHLVVNDGHSLYFETAGELGWPGLVLLLGALLTPLAVAASRLRGSERFATGAFMAGGLALLVHAGVDWDWEMPAVFAWYFAAGGLVLADANPVAGWAPGRLTRILIGLGCLVLALVPLSIARSQDGLARATQAFRAGDCRTAVDAALDSLEALPSRPEPFELLGYCDIRAGDRGLAVSVMRAARSRDPEAWEYAYGLAVAEALDGRDPRPMAALAARLNPQDQRAAELSDRMRRGGPGRWARDAANAPIPYD